MQWTSLDALLTLNGHGFGSECPGYLVCTRTSLVWLFSCLVLVGASCRLAKSVRKKTRVKYFFSLILCRRALSLSVSVFWLNLHIMTAIIKSTNPFTWRFVLVLRSFTINVDPELFLNLQNPCIGGKSFQINFHIHTGVFSLERLNSHALARHATPPLQGTRLWVKPEMCTLVFDNVTLYFWVKLLSDCCGEALEIGKMKHLLLLF